MDLLSLGKNPINDDQPTGAEVRYEPEFEELQAEIDKLSTPSASGGLDWQKVSDLAALILAEKSKNLLVASYLAVSQVHLNQIDGLAIGLTIIHDLLDRYWEDVYPPKKRLRGRIGAIEWWIEKTAAALEGLELEVIAAQKLQEMTSNLANVDALLKKYLTDPPLLRSIQRIVETIPAEEEPQPIPEPEPPKTEPQPEPEPPKVEPQPSRPSPQPVASTAMAAENLPSHAILSDADVRKAISSCQQMLHKVASFLLQKDSADPLAYRWRRIAAWSQLVTLPPANDGITQFPPPGPNVVQSLNNLKENANHNVLVEWAEQRLSQFICWFDLNRWVIESLEVLGDGYRQATEMVCQETASLLHRLPGLRDLAFSDGTPFADTETKRWLDRIEFNGGAIVAVSTAKSEVDQTAGQPDPAAETIKKASALANQKKLVEAVQLLQQKLQHCFSNKEKLTWRLALSQILLEARRPDLALPHLDLILKDIDTYQLASWDPGLAVKGFKLVWAGFNSHKDDEFRKNAETILNRISELDPVAALTLKK
jgi:type VI secretion system protein VasJ